MDRCREWKKTKWEQLVTRECQEKGQGGDQEGDGWMASEGIFRHCGSPWRMHRTEHSGNQEFGPLTPPSGKRRRRRYIYIYIYIIIYIYMSVYICIHTPRVLRPLHFLKIFKIQICMQLNWFLAWEKGIHICVVIHIWCSRVAAVI